MTAGSPESLAPFDGPAAGSILTVLPSAHPLRPAHGTHAVRPQSHRLSAHRRSPHGAVQLAVCPPARRPVHPAHRRHRPAAERDRGAAADPGRLSLAGHRLGRRAGSRRAVRSLLPVAAARTATRPPWSNCCSTASRTAIMRCPRRLQAERAAAEAEKRPFTYSRRWMAETDGRCRPLGGGRRAGGRAAEDAARPGPASSTIASAATWSSSGPRSRTT